MARAINSYFYYAGIDYRASWPLRLSSREMLSIIVEMLEKDIPVIISVGPNTPNLSGKKKIYLYSQTEKRDHNYDENIKELYQYYIKNETDKTNGHYVTITGIIKDEVSTDKRVMLRVSSWGREYYINYDEYRKYIEEKNGTWTSSMVYIK